MLYKMIAAFGEVMKEIIDFITMHEYLFARVHLKVVAIQTFCRGCMALKKYKTLKRELARLKQEYEEKQVQLKAEYTTNN